MAEEVFDYIVVGPGAAGAIVAARLGETPNIRVLLLEIGPDDRSIYIETAGGYFKVRGTKRTFLFETEAEPALNGHKLPFVQGRTLGGGTSVNAMCYLRGQREDYDDWKSAGCIGWGWDDVLPYFRKSEANIRLSVPHHGIGGPMPVSDGGYRQELCQAFVRAAQEVRLPDGRAIEYNHDFNGDRQEGVGFYQTMSLHGERASTARTFLKEAAGRKNLDVRVESAVTRLVVKDGRATGVVVRDKARREYNVTARREVILSAGAFGTPKLLMLSGIGPGEHLSRLDIPIVADVEAVGANFQDHVQLPYDASLKGPRALGASAIVTSRDEAKLMRAKALGASHVINTSRTPDWAAAAVALTNDRGVDHIFELIGGDNLRQSRRAARRHRNDCPTRRRSCAYGGSPGAAG